MNGAEWCEQGNLRNAMCARGLSASPGGVAVLDVNTRVGSASRRKKMNAEHCGNGMAGSSGTGCIVGRA